MRNPVGYSQHKVTIFQLFVEDSEGVDFNISAVLFEFRSYFAGKY